MFIYFSIILVPQVNRPDNELLLFKLLDYLNLSLFIKLFRQCRDPLCDYAWIAMVYLKDQLYAWITYCQDGATNVSDQEQIVRSYWCFFRETSSMHGSLIVGMELRISQIEDKLSDVDARASEEADCNANDRDLDRFIYSGDLCCFVYLVTCQSAWQSEFLFKRQS